MQDPSESYLCQICGGMSFFSILRVRDPLSAQTEPFQLLKCAGCGLVHTDPSLSMVELDKYYADDYWHRDSSGRGVIKRGFGRSIERWFLDFRMKLTMKPLRSRIPHAGRVLDVGCGVGDRLTLLNLAGYESYGVEVSESAAAIAERVHGADRVFHGTFHRACYPDDFFDCVTFYHVFEHLQCPQDVLEEARRILKPGGVVFIELPNIDSVGYRLFKKRWQPLHVPQHLFHFSPSSLTALVEKLGFRVLQIGYFSARASCAGWVLSLLPFFHPQNLRKQEARGRNMLPAKLLYLGLQILALPFASSAALCKSGDIITVVSVKQP